MLDYIINVMLGTMISDLHTAGLAPPYPASQFKRKSSEHVQAAAVHIRHCYIEHNSTTNGKLVQSLTRRNFISSYTLWVEYPRVLRDLQQVVAYDAPQLKQRLEQTAYQGWPASGIMAIEAIPGRLQVVSTGAARLPVELQINYVMETV